MVSNFLYFTFSYAGKNLMIYTLMFFLSLFMSQQIHHNLVLILKATMYKLIFQLFDDILSRLKKAYANFLGKVGDPLDEGVLYGPMHSQMGVDGYLDTLAKVKENGGE